MNESQNNQNSPALQNFRVNGTGNLRTEHLSTANKQSTAQQVACYLDGIANNAARINELAATKLETVIIQFPADSPRDEKRQEMPSLFTNLQHSAERIEDSLRSIERYLHAVEL